MGKKRSFLDKGREFLMMLARQYFADGVGATAASLTYYALFAIFPFLIAISSLLGFLDLPPLSLEGDMAALLPTEVITLLNRTLSHMSESSSGAFLTFGIVFTLWFPLRAVKNLMSSVNRIYGGQVHRQKPWRVLMLTVFFVIFVPVQVVVMILGESVLEGISKIIPLAENTIHLWSTLRFLPVAVMVFVAVSATYQISTSQMNKWRYIFPGAGVSMVGWLIISLVFSAYVNNMGNYSLIYGSIGAIIAFLVWTNLSMTLLLLGAEINNVLMIFQTKYKKKSPVPVQAQVQNEE